MPELHEELSIDIGNSQPWLTRTFHYPHAIAHLPLFRVTRWQGEPHGRENQRLSWQDPHHIDIGPLLPANHDIMNALRLPPMSAITQAGKLGIDIFMLRLAPRCKTACDLCRCGKRKWMRIPCTALFWMSLEYVTPITPG